MLNREDYEKALSRALGMVNLDPLNENAGCCDRNYWHYQDGKGFPVGSFQMVGLSFLLGSSVFPEEKETLAQTAELVFLFWSKSILKKGMLSEYYEGQESFCATAHTTMAAAIAYSIDSNKFYFLKPAIQKALNLLSSVKNRPDSANQTIAARIAWDLAIENSIIIDIKNPFSPKCSKEGWLSEYHGFDLGYSLECVDFCILAITFIQSLEKKETYIQYIEKLIAFLNLSVVQFTFSPMLSSRGNPHLLLGGIRAMSQSGCVSAQEILYQLETIQKPSLVNYDTTDDKYFAFFHLLSLSIPFIAEKKNWIKELKVNTENKIYFKDAGLLFFKQGSVKGALSIKRGGSLIIRNATEDFELGGYHFQKGKKQYSTHLSLVSLKEGDGFLEFSLKASSIKSRLKLVQNSYFQFLLKQLMRFTLVKRNLNKYILDRVSKKKQSFSIGTRRINFQKDRIIILDTFKINLEKVLQNISWWTEDGHSTRQYSNIGNVFCQQSPFRVGEKKQFCIKTNRYGPSDKNYLSENSEILNQTI